MSRLYKLAALSGKDRLLLTEAMFWVAIMRLGLWTLPFDRLRRTVERLTVPRQPGLPARDPNEERIAWAVRVASRYVPRATCLTQALAAQVLWARRGCLTELRIGVAMPDDNGLAAHAWVESRGRVLIGGTEPGKFQSLLHRDEQPT